MTPGYPLRMSSGTTPDIAAAVDLDRLRAAVDEARTRYDGYLSRGLKLDITRGKPCREQLDLAEGMISVLQPGDHVADDAGDLRNYGGAPMGLQGLREIFAPLLDVPVEQLVARDNSSLSLMHFCLASSFFHAPPGGQEPWAGRSVRFLAPSPGYDRHFSVCADLGIELIPVPLTDAGPELDAVAQLVRDDPGIKGIWCVPKYSNPTGITYSDEVVRALAALPAAADDFRIYWDNAYAIHHLADQGDELTSVLTACAEAGNPDRVFVFASTSKVSLAGGGVSFFGASPANVAWFLARDGFRTIGPDKLNQLRHIRFFGSTRGVTEHMERHRAILAPKFDAVAKALHEDLEPLEIASWTDPKGGYFVSLDVVPGTAKRVVELAGKAGVALTPAGATYPLGVDPRDRNIRIAPTFPGMGELEEALRVLTTCVVLAAGETLLA